MNVAGNKKPETCINDRNKRLLRKEDGGDHKNKG